MLDMHPTPNQKCVHIAKNTKHCQRDNVTNTRCMLILYQANMTFLFCGTQKVFEEYPGCLPNEIISSVGDHALQVTWVM